MFNGDITLDEFLNVYWQQKPVLFRNAFPDIRAPLSADEMAGLACEEYTNARLIIESKEKPYWSVEHGPLEEDRFSQLASTNWTLLVSDVEKLAPEGRELLENFRFIPDWRIDDLMMSYAVDGGSVGPHIDAYDVFLLQVEGQRHWGINSSKDYTRDESLENIELKILKEFNADKQWILNPGDMLYLPPNVAHHGVAQGECITCSIGFRSPSVHTLISEYAESIAGLLPEDFRYSDPDLQQQEHPGEISQQAIRHIKQLIQENLKIDEGFIQNWFGEFITETNSSSDIHDQADHEVITDLSQLKHSKEVLHTPGMKFLFSQKSDRALLFVDGRSYTSSLHFAQTICSSNHINGNELLLSASDDDKVILLELFSNELIYCAR